MRQYGTNRAIQGRVVPSAGMSHDETADEDDGETSLFALSRDKLLLVLIIFVGVAGTGLARRFLGEFGYNNVGRIVFILGYGGMIFIVWYGWIRPMDITGPQSR
ncbi:hypothetical protein GL213_03910 [Halogeometricum borinquense]|uniref:Uncharacterized protein n=2 Tax=Halogeometricum borinquense TaxID=60847 RepID=A0A6C0UJX0_9EURY|nr:hypothetical protein G3I44_16540 [Halogeometricum borinquense]QIQ75742.1 hypothetical protein GL213_03910 [Halogeometricum borinquense]